MQSARGALQRQQQQRTGAARPASASANHARPHAATAEGRLRRAAARPSSPSFLRPHRRRPAAPLAAAAASGDAAPAPGPQQPNEQQSEDEQQGEQQSEKNEERKEYYDAREMPPLPLTVARVTVPELDSYVVVDSRTESTRLASLAIFTEMWRANGAGSDAYGGRLNRRSAITALCMYDRDDVAAARAKGPGLYPSIDLLERVYREGLDVEVVVEEK